MRIMLSLSEEMHDALENERNQMMLKNIQEVVRRIILEHFNSENQKAPKTQCDEVSSPDDPRSCEDVPDQEVLALFHPFINFAQDLGFSSDLNGLVQICELLSARVGALFDLNTQSPLSNDQRQNLIVFMRDDNPRNARMRFVLGGLRGLINVDGITELEPYMKVIMDIIRERINQRAPEVQI